MRTRREEALARTRSCRHSGVTSYRQFCAEDERVEAQPYYKEVLVEDCDPLTDPDCKPEGAFFKVLPPFAVSCTAPERWRNKHCSTQRATNGKTVEQMVAQRDWMQFLWNWNRRGPDNSQLEEIYAAHKQVCNPTACIDPMTRASCVFPACPRITVPGNARSSSLTSMPRLEWLPLPVPTFTSALPTDWMTLSPTQQATELVDIGATLDQVEELRRWLSTRSFLAGATAHYDAESAAGDATADERLEHFNEMALRHGVSDDTTPP